MIPVWAEDYIGIPFQEHGRDHTGCDCYGLVRLILMEQANLTLPAWSSEYETTTAGQTVANALRANAIDTDDWLALDAGQERLFDGVLMSGIIDGRRYEMHVGLVLAPGILIHVESGTNASLGRYRRDRNMNRRIRGFYRHREC